MEFEQRLSIMREVSGRDALAFIVRFYVYFHAGHPELSRLMSQEATRQSWRLEYLIEKHIRPSTMKWKSLYMKPKDYPGTLSSTGTTS